MLRDVEMGNSILFRKYASAMAATGKRQNNLRKRATSGKFAFYWSMYYSQGFKIINLKKELDESIIL